MTPIRDGVEFLAHLDTERLTDFLRNHDLELKKQLYEQFSVPEYWIVDPENQTIKRYSLGENGTFADPEVFTESITFDGILGGAVVDLKRVW